MDYLSKLMSAVDRERPWNGFAILIPYTEGFPGASEYAINPMPMFHATSYVRYLERMSHMRRESRPL